MIASDARWNERVSAMRSLHLYNDVWFGRTFLRDSPGIYLHSGAGRFKEWLFSGSETSWMQSKRALRYSGLGPSTTVSLLIILTHQYAHFLVSSNSTWHSLSLSFVGQCPSELHKCWLWHHFYCFGAQSFLRSDLIKKKYGFKEILMESLVSQVKAVQS